MLEAGGHIRGEVTVDGFTNDRYGGPFLEHLLRDKDEHPAPTATPNGYLVILVPILGVENDCLHVSPVKKHRCFKCFDAMVAFGMQGVGCVDGAKEWCSTCRGRVRGGKGFVL